MDEILESVRKVTDVIAEISAATSEQSAGISQVNLAIVEMDNVTQQNAALVEQAAAAAAAMQEQSAHLLSEVSVFKLRNDTLQPAPLRAVPVKKTAVRPAIAARQQTKEIKKATPPKKTITSEARKENDDQWEEF